MYKFFSKTVLKCAKIRTNCFIRFKVLDNQTLLLNIFWATLYSIMFHLVQYSKQVEPVEEFCCLATSLRIMEIVRRKSMLEVLKQTQHSIDWITFGETGNWDYRLRSDFTIPSWKQCFSAVPKPGLWRKQSRDSASGNCTTQMAEKDPEYIVERYGAQW